MISKSCIFFLLFSSFCLSQTVTCDLLEKQLDTAKSFTSRVKVFKSNMSTANSDCLASIYLNLGDTYRDNGIIDSSFVYYDKAILLSKKTNDLGHLSSGYTSKAYLYAMKNRIDECLDLLKNAKVILEQIPNSEYWVMYYQTHAYLSDLKSDYKNALVYTDSAITIVDKNNYKSYFTSSYFNKGVYSMRLSKYKEAIDSFFYILEFLEKESITNNIENVHYMLGVNYENLQEYEKANLYFEKCIQRVRKLENDYLLLLSYNRVVKSRRMLRKIPEAFNAIDSAIVLAEQFKDNGQLSDAYYKKGDMLLDEFHEGSEAEFFLEKAYNLATKASSSKKMDNLMLTLSIAGMVKVNLFNKNYNKALKYLKLYENQTKIDGILLNEKNLNYYYSEYYEGIGKSSKALMHYKKFDELKDSIASKETKLEIADLEKKYDTQKKELEILTLSQENNTKEKVIADSELKKNLFLVLSLILLGILIFLFVVYRTLNKQKKEIISAHDKLAEINKVKNKLFSIISHDLRSMIIPFQRAGRVLKYHIEKKNYNTVVELSEELEKNSKGLSNMLDNLLNWSLEQMNGYSLNPEIISVQNEFKEILEVFDSQVKNKNNKTELIFDEDVNLLFDKGAFHVIFRNLINNAIKFTENGKIRIEFNKKNNDLSFKIMDNGIGIDEKRLKRLFELEKNDSNLGTKGEKGTGLGLGLVHKFVEINKGIIKVSSKLNMGTSFELTFPIT